MHEDTMQKKLESMEAPAVELPRQQYQLRMTFVSAKKAAWWSVALIILPAVFVGYNVLKYIVGLSFLPDFDAIFSTEKSFALFNALSPVVFLGGGLLVIILNLLAILHISFENLAKEVSIRISVKKRGWNIALLTIAVLTLVALLSYVVLENWQCFLGLQESC